MRPVRGFSDGTFSICIEKVAEIGDDLDAVHVALERGIGPDLQRRLVRPDAGERQCDRDVEVGGKADRRLARRAIEDAQGLRDVLDADIVLGKIGRAGKTAHRLPRHHAHGLDFSFRRGGDGIEAEQGAGRHHDLAAMFAGEIDQMLVDEDGAGAEHQHGFAGSQERLGDGGQQARRRAFDHEIGERLQGFDRHHRRRVGEMGEPRGGLAAVIGGNRRQRAAGDAAVERVCDLQPDGAEAGDGDAERRGPVLRDFFVSAGANGFMGCLATNASEAASRKRRGWARRRGPPAKLISGPVRIPSGEAHKNPTTARVAGNREKSCHGHFAV